MDINAYLQRIASPGPHPPTATTLHTLQVAHLRTVPFENLSIHRQEPISLTETALFAKIVTQRRGGFCYELNGLFATLLQAMGFSVQLLSARVMDGNGRFGPPFDHLTLLVTLTERWLVDVGFGDSFITPLRLDEPEPQTQGPRAYQIVPTTPGADHWLLQQRQGYGEWEIQYQFGLHPYQLADFAPMCHYHQTSPDSAFTQKRICTRATENGRITLSDLRLIITHHDQRHEHRLPDEAAHAAALWEQFGIR